MPSLAGQLSGPSIEATIWAATAGIMRSFGRAIVRPSIEARRTRPSTFSRPAGLAGQLSGPPLLPVASRTWVASRHEYVYEIAIKTVYDDPCCRRLAAIHGYIDRFVDRILAADLQGWPAVLVTGPRAVGKTTTSQRRAEAVLRLDRPEERSIVLDDPDAAISVGPFPLLLDEWQHTPEILGAVKRAVDTDRRPGRYIITGSARSDLIAGSWPGTGRFLDLQLWPLTGRERFGDAAAPSLFDRWDTPARFAVPADPPDILGYLRIALAGGFPAAVAASGPGQRARWMRGYVQAASTRDLGELDSGRGPPSQPRSGCAATFRRARCTLPGWSPTAPSRSPPAWIARPRRATTTFSASCGSSLTCPPGDPTA